MDGQDGEDYEGAGGNQCRARLSLFIVVGVRVHVVCLSERYGIRS